MPVWGMVRRKNHFRCAFRVYSVGMDTTYCLLTHRHNFAVWAAARAAQRGFTSVAILKAALESSGLPGEISDSSKWPECPEQFDVFHRLFCTKIMDQLRTTKVGNVTYGRAAKLVAIYLKAMIVCSEHDGAAFAKVIHPPIDRVLLHNLSRDDSFDRQLRRHWGNVTWTSLSESEYFKLIGQFRKSGLDTPAFWMLERYWNPTGDVGT